MRKGFNKVLTDKGQQTMEHSISFCVFFKHLNAELNPICHFLALLGAHHILHFSRIRVKYILRRSTIASLLCVEHYSKEEM